MNKKTILLVVWLVLLGGLFFGISHFGSGEDGTTPRPGNPPSPTPTITAKDWPQVVAHAAAPPRGNPNARYTVAEFGDFECPQCGKVRPVLEKLLQKYPDQMNVIFIHRPFPNIHHWALKAAQASQIAAAQGKFWPMYDILYANQAKYGEPERDLPLKDLAGFAAEAGLDKAQFLAAMKAGQGVQAVKTAADFADSITVQLTPTLMVHDNTKDTLTIYTGLRPESPVYVRPDAHYFDTEFVAHPPWLGNTAGKK